VSEVCVRVVAVDTGLLSGPVRFRFHALSEEEPCPGPESMDVSSADEAPEDAAVHGGQMRARQYGTVAGAWVSACEVGTGSQAVVRAGKVLVNAEWCSTPAGLIELQVRGGRRSF
jgi:hypothetical protein